MAFLAWYLLYVVLSNWAADFMSIKVVGNINVALVFGLLQALTNLGFMLLSASGKSYALMVAVIGAENLCGGMGTIAFVALLMGMCDRRFSATQYALLSALAALGRVYVGPAAGVLVDGLGWTPFFFFTFVIALPGIAMLWWQRPRIEALDHSPR